MRRNAWMAAVAVAVVGLLVAPLAFGSNMGFKLERNLDLVPGGLSYYSMSFPFYRSFGDLWHSGNNDFGSDAAVMSDDVLADWFTGGDGTCDGGWECDGSISLLRFVNTPGTDFNKWVGQTIAWNAFQMKAVISGTAFDIDNPTDPGRGFLVQIPSGTQFPVVIVGSHNPDVTDFVMTYEAGALNKNPFSLPYHFSYTHTTDPGLDNYSEALLDNIPRPDMENGVSLLRFENNPTDPAFNTWVGQTVIWNAFTNSKQFSGTPFPLTPGDGYLFILNADPPGSVPVTVPLPHY